MLGGDTYRARIDVPGRGEITYSGGFYALVDAAELGFALPLDEERQLAGCANAITGRSYLLSRAQILVNPGDAMASHDDLAHILYAGEPVLEAAG